MRPGPHGLGSGSAARRHVVPTNEREDPNVTEAATEIRDLTAEDEDDFLAGAVACSTEPGECEACQ